MNILNTLRRNMPDVDRDDLLDMIGLESRRSTTERMLPALAIFSAGVLVGVSIGLMVAQKPGSELRGQLRHRLRRESNGVDADDSQDEQSPPVTGPTAVV